jgi:hypothetical protein
MVIESTELKGSSHTSSSRLLQTVAAILAAITRWQSIISAAIAKRQSYQELSQGDNHISSYRHETATASAMSFHEGGNKVNNHHIIIICTKAVVGKVTVTVLRYKVT